MVICAPGREQAVDGVLPQLTNSVCTVVKSPYSKESVARVMDRWNLKAPESAVPQGSVFPAEKVVGLHREAPVKGGECPGPMPEDRLSFL